jgi:cytochrome c2
MSILLLVVAAWAVAPTAPAQTGAETPGRPTTDQQKSGEALFYQNCTFCHEHEPLKRRLVPQFLGPTLIGLYRTKSPSDDTVRMLILKGVPRRMTGYQYTLTSQDVDDLIAYLKIR